MKKFIVTTNQGAFTLELDDEKAPLTVANFEKYAADGHYNGTIFHRVIEDFMIQGGGFDASMRQKPVKPPIRNESSNGLKNDNYTVAMARTNVSDSATSQFFVNVKNNDFLNYAGASNPGYAVFGKVTDGKDVVDKIRKVATGNSGGHQNVPTQAVLIEKIEPA